MFLSHVLFFVAGVECDDILIFIWYNKSLLAFWLLSATPFE